MAHKLKKCKHCKEYAEVAGGIQTPGGFFCSYDHAIQFARDKTLKQRSGEQKAAKVQRRKTFTDNDRSYQLAKTQEVFNEFIRLRDINESCISCGTTADVQYAAGHYRSRGAAGHLRFNQFNTNKQCNRNCNLAKSGNIGEYRIGLVKKYGIEKVEWIESQNDAKKWTLEEIKAIKFYYRRMVKQLKNPPAARR